MAAYIIVNVEVTDTTRYADYIRVVGDSLVPYEGRFLVRGGKAEKLEGSLEPKRVVVLEFPSLERAKAWWACAEYAAARAVRANAARVRMVAVEGLTP